MNKIQQVIVASALAISCASIAHADFDAKPYIGADVFYTKNGLKNNLYKMGSKKVPEGNVHVGVMAAQNFGLELGYSLAKKSSATTDVTYTNTAKNLTNVAGKFKTSTKVKGPYLQLIGEVPLGADNLYGIGGLGLAWKRVNGTVDVVRNSNSTSMDTIKFKDSRVLPMVTAGVKYKFNDNVGMRAVVAWEQTSRLQAKSTPDIGKVKMKDTFKVGAGVEYSF